MVNESLSELEQQRDLLYARLVAVGDFRRGSINETYRRCGKPNCACADRDHHRGHGPRYLWTRSVGGKTRTRQLDASEVGKVRAELAAYGEFSTLAEQIVAINELICQARPVSASADRQAGSGGEKGGSARI